MKPVVVQGTLLKCSFGNVPVPLMLLPGRKAKAMMPIAVKTDHVPLVNILPFGMCSNPANPMVAAATAAALGVLTPMPCIPCTASDWTRACSQVKVQGKEVLNMDSKLRCLYGGEIGITAPICLTVLL